MLVALARILHKKSGGLPSFMQYSGYMKKLYLPFLLLAMLGLLMSCGSDKTADKLNGKWTVDIAVSLESSGVVWNDGSRALAEAMLAGMGYEFDTKAGKMTFLGMGQGLSHTVDYTVVSQTDTSVVLSFQGQNITFEFIDDNTIKMVDVQGGVTVFKKD